MSHFLHLKYMTAKGLNQLVLDFYDGLIERSHCFQQNSSLILCHVIPNTLILALKLARGHKLWGLVACKAHFTGT